MKARYRALALEHHPDAGGDARKFLEVQEAFEALSTGPPERAAANEEDNVRAPSEEVMDALRRVTSGRVTRETCERESRTAPLAEH